MSRDLRDVSPVTGILMGGFTGLMGLAIVFVALDWIRVDPATIHAPRWVLGLCGGMFALTGGVILYYGVRNGLGTGSGSTAEQGEEEKDFHVGGWLLGGVICTGLAVVAGWVAFGPGERAFSGSVGVGGIGVSGSGGSEALGRWIFGVGAVLTGALAVWGWVYGIRRLMRGEGERDGGAS